MYPLFIAIFTYLYLVQQYTENIGVFYTGWESPNEHRDDPCFPICVIDPAIHGPAFRAFVRRLFS